MVFAVLCMAGPGSFTAKDSTAKEAESLHLAWDASNDPAVVGYRVYYGDSSANSSTVNSSTSNSSTSKNSARYTKSVQVEGRLTCSAVISGLEDGKTYFFAVTAFTADGKESAYSPEITYKAGGTGSQDGRSGAGSADQRGRSGAGSADQRGRSGAGSAGQRGRSGAGSAGQRGRSFDETGKQPVTPHAIPPPPRRVPGSAAKTSTAIPAGGPTAPTPAPAKAGASGDHSTLIPAAGPTGPAGGPTGGKRPPSSRISRPNSSPSPKAVRPPPPGGKIPPSRN